MSRFEAIKNMNETEMADFLCDLLQRTVPDNVYACENCPAKDKRCVGNKGFKDWIKEEVNEDEYI